MTAPDRLDLLARLWRPEGPFEALLPRTLDELRDFHARLKSFMAAASRAHHGRIDARAIVDGDVLSLGEGSVIEAGAVVHPTCRLVMGNRSVVRAGAVLRDEVVVGDDCIIGVNCEIVRSVLIGPNTLVMHGNLVADSIVGRDVLLSGNVWIANTHLGKKTIRLVDNGRRIDTGRTHLGALIGDGVRIGVSTTICPGTVILPELTLPPSITLLGTVDDRRRKTLLQMFVRTWSARDMRADADRTESG